MGVDTSRPVSLRDLVRSYGGGGLEDARKREALLRGDSLELDIEVKRGELCSMESAREVIASALKPVAVLLQDLPDRHAERAFPHDPKHGRSVLLAIAAELRDRVLQGLSDKPAKPKPRKRKRAMSKAKAA